MIWVLHIRFSTNVTGFHQFLAGLEPSLVRVDTALVEFYNKVLSSFQSRWTSWNRVPWASPCRRHSTTGSISNQDALIGREASPRIHLREIGRGKSNRGVETKRNKTNGPRRRRSTSNKKKHPTTTTDKENKTDASATCLFFLVWTPLFRIDCVVVVVVVVVEEFLLT